MFAGGGKIVVYMMPVSVLYMDNSLIMYGEDLYWNASQSIKTTITDVSGYRSLSGL